MKGGRPTEVHFFLSPRRRPIRRIYLHHDCWPFQQLRHGLVSGRGDMARAWVPSMDARTSEALKSSPFSCHAGCRKHGKRPPLGSLDHRSIQSHAAYNIPIGKPRIPFSHISMVSPGQRADHTLQALSYC